MPDNNRKGRRSRPNNISPNRPVPGRPSQTAGENEPELGGFIGWLVRNRRLLGWLELVVAILLLGLALNGFLSGGLYFPFAFGLLGLRFFYAYVQHTMGVNFGRTGPILNLILLLGALVFAILGITIEGNAS